MEAVKTLEALANREYQWGFVSDIEADALPELEMKGTVEKISDVFEEKRGDITYTVRLLLSNPDPALRWGMTVRVEFK